MSRLDARIAAMLPRSARTLPMLRADDSPGVHSRRRADCANLRACEDVWIEVNWDVQAKCPRRCSKLEVRP